MKKNTFQILEFDQILNMLAEEAFSEKTQEQLRALRPFMDERLCQEKMKETTEARRLLESFGTPPLGAMKELEKTLDLTEKGSMLVPEQLSAVAEFLASCKRMKNYLKRAECVSNDVAAYGRAFYPLEDLFEEIDRAIRNGQVDDSASPRLRDTRRKIENINGNIKLKLETMLRTHREKCTDGFVSTRNGRFVLPIKKEFKNMIPGSVLDVSSTGSTCFIEPTAIKNMQEEKNLYQIEEENEIRKVLYTLTALVDEHQQALRTNMECMTALDFAFAKGRLSLKLKGIPVSISADREIQIIKGRHPLLNPEECVPLDFHIGKDYDGIVITGPNTGGKTVALKTVGLLSIMAQCGLHVPAGEGSKFSMHTEILCDIGDGQSISENLSTFSAHITSIIQILNAVTHESLVLLDELGSGTDPAEGMGIAVSILEELRKKGCIFLATTHYPEIKDYAEVTEGIINARMAFDRETLRPLYQMEIGEAGESCAIHIARRLGFPEHMLERAKKEAYGGKEKRADHHERWNTSNVEKQTAADGKLSDANDGERKGRNENRHDHRNESGNGNRKDARKDGKKGQEKSRIRRIVEKPEKEPESQRFRIGDSVMILPEKTVGLVWKTADEAGNIGVQVKKEKRWVNHKRLQLLVSAEEMYPEDYDFSIVFDTVENRKARHQMEKRHRPDLEIKNTLGSFHENS